MKTNIKKRDFTNFENFSEMTPSEMNKVTGGEVILYYYVDSEGNIQFRVGIKE